jgi:hypothetical protein
LEEFRPPAAEELSDPAPPRSRRLRCLPSGRHAPSTSRTVLSLDRPPSSNTWDRTAYRITRPRLTPSSATPAPLAVIPILERQSPARIPWHPTYPRLQAPVIPSARMATAPTATFPGAARLPTALLLHTALPPFTPSSLRAGQTPSTATNTRSEILPGSRRRPALSIHRPFPGCVNRIESPKRGRRSAGLLFDPSNARFAVGQRMGSMIGTITPGSNLQFGSGFVIGRPLPCPSNLS